MTTMSLYQSRFFWQQFPEPKFSAKKIRLFQAVAVMFIILGHYFLGEDFYLIPKILTLPGYEYLSDGLHWLRVKLLQSLNNTITEPHSSFVAGIILGARESLPPTIVEDFRRTGTSHLVAVSGYNVTVVANALSALLIGAGLNRQRAFWFVTCGLIAFAILTGAQAAVVRAAIMGIIVLTAKHIGRPSQTSIAITWAALIMLIFNPSIAQKDIGFQLSFLSTLGLIYFSSWFQAKLPQLWPDFIKEPLASTLSATLLTAPLIIYYFGRLSLTSLPANLLVLPVIPWLMLFGSAAMFVGLINSFLGMIPGAISFLLSSYVLWILKLFSSIPQSEISVTKSDYSIFLIYILIAIFYRIYICQAKKLRYS